MPVASGGIGTAWITSTIAENPKITLMLSPKELLWSHGGPCELGQIRAEGASSVDDYFCGAYAPRGGRARLTPSAWS